MVDGGHKKQVWQTSETSVVLSSSRLWLWQSKSCGRPGKPSLTGAPLWFHHLTCRLSGVLLLLLGSRESGGTAVFSHRFFRSLYRERAGGEGNFAWLGRADVLEFLGMNLYNKSLEILETHAKYETVSAQDDHGL